MIDYSRCCVKGGRELTKTSSMSATTISTWPESGIEWMKMSRPKSTTSSRKTSGTYQVLKTLSICPGNRREHES